MTQHFHTVVIGGGCLGCASAISVQRRINKSSNTSKERVCLIEKSVIGSGLTARHSGIVRAANAVSKAAYLAKEATNHWKNLDSIWGVSAEYQTCGALWIAPGLGGGRNKKWDELAKSMTELDIEFKKVSRNQAQEICTDSVILHDDEMYFFEPNAIQFDPAIIRHALYEALLANDIEVAERTAVKGFETNNNNEIKTVLTTKGTITCDYVVNAAGAWSPSIFASLGIRIPVSVEPVHVVNWLTSQREIGDAMPIIADYVNLAYFRLWRDSEIHMHQPRRRSVRETARAFAESTLNVTGADFINDPTQQGLGYSQIRVYEDIAKKRFKDVDSGIYGSGFRSYFDITPDLKFILGPDHRVGNLIHCLGAGQAFKYTPVFGEIVADCIIGAGNYYHDIAEFSITRFDDQYMKNFWDKVSGKEHSLETEGASL